MIDKKLAYYVTPNALKIINDLGLIVISHVQMVLKIKAFFVGKHNIAVV
jgi:hypothetical protein